MTEDQSSSPNYVKVYTAYGQMAGEMVRLLLESMQISVKTQEESIGVAFGLTLTPLGRVDIFVPAEDESAAIEVIQAMEAGQISIDEPSLVENDEDDIEPE